MIAIEELVNKAKANDKDAFCKLILYVQKDLYKIARSRLNSESDIEDAIQSSIFIAYSNINTLKNSKSFKSWILKILINECHHIYNISKHEYMKSEKYAAIMSSEEYIDEISDFDNIITVLNEKEKQIFSLRFKDDLSIKEISKKLDINENTIKSILRKGKKKIVKSYKPFTLILFILCLLISTTTIAASLIGYIGELFELTNKEIDNSGLLEVITTLNSSVNFNSIESELMNKYNVF